MSLLLHLSPECLHLIYSYPFVLQLRQRQFGFSLVFGDGHMLFFHVNVLLSHVAPLRTIGSRRSQDLEVVPQQNQIPRTRHASEVFGREHGLSAVSPCHCTLINDAY